MRALEMSKRLERYWRKAEASDIASGPFPVARFRDDASAPWEYGRLIGFHHGTCRPYGSDADWYNLAEVYYAPDPGEGWRLMDIDKDSYRQDGIEHWSDIEKAWKPRRLYDKTKFFESSFYRIRITPTVTYVPFAWEDREQFRGRHILVTWENGAMQELPSLLFTRSVQGKLLIDGIDAERLVVVGKFTDTGKPVGKEVKNEVG